MLNMIMQLLTTIIFACLVLALVSSLAVAFLWYLPGVFRLLARLRHVDRDAYELAGGMPFTSIEGSLPLRLFLDAELFENLKDPRARDLGRSIARSYRLIKKLWWAMAVCVALLVIIRLLEQVADF